jgi:hypothetical protein
MAQRKPIRPVTGRALSSRQWAWEFLRFNAEYRKAYAEWLELPEAVRNASVSSTGTPLGDCPPDTPMSFFKVTPFAKIDETVSEWLARTEVERNFGWSVEPSSKFIPSNDFLIAEWVDPKVTPLPKVKEQIWDKFDVETVAGLVTDRHLPKRAAVSIRPLTDIHELALIVDVRSPLVDLEKQFKKAVLSHREALRARGIGDEPDVYGGKVIINNRGIYDEYIRILQRLDDGETEEEIRYHEQTNAPRLKLGESYTERVKKQIPKAIELRDGGYKRIAYRDDHLGDLKPKQQGGNIR